MPDGRGAPRRQLPPRSRGGSSDALDRLPAQLAAARELSRAQAALEEGAPGPNSGSQARASFTEASTLDKQVGVCLFWRPPVMYV